MKFAELNDPADPEAADLGPLVAERSAIRIVLRIPTAGPANRGSFAEGIAMLLPMLVDVAQVLDAVSQILIKYVRGRVLERLPQVIRLAQDLLQGLVDDLVPLRLLGRGRLTLVEECGLELDQRALERAAALANLMPLLGRARSQRQLGREVVGQDVEVEPLVHVLDREADVLEPVLQDQGQGEGQPIQLMDPRRCAR